MNKGIRLTFWIPILGFFYVLMFVKYANWLYEPRETVSYVWEMWQGLSSAIILYVIIERFIK